MKILILSPHMDDAFLSLGGLIATSSKVHNIKVVDFFSFDPLTLDKFNTKNKLKNIDIRKHEEQVNSQLSGVSIDFLGLPAGWKERGYKKWQMSFNKLNDREVLEKITEYVRKKTEDFDLVFSPLAVGGHVDHRLIRFIVSTKLPKSKVAYYEDLPYVLEKSFLKFSDGFIKQSNLSSFILRLNGADLKKKETFVSNYKSQLTQEEMKFVIKYTRGNFAHKIVKTPGEILWGNKEVMGLLNLLK